MRGSDGLYHIGGKTYQELTGSRARVKHHTAYQTVGGLRDENLKYNKSGKIVSRKKSEANPLVRLLRKGYHTMKGRFGHVKRKVKVVLTRRRRKRHSTRKRHKRRRKSRRRRSRRRR